MLNFYYKLLIRQLRHSAMRLFCVAIALACAVTFSITLLGDRLEQLFLIQSKEVIAADIVLQSTSELKQVQKNIIDQSPLKTANLVIFQTMANVENGNGFLLSSVKAVTKGYPLLGQLQVSNALYTDVYATQEIPTHGEAWVEDRILNELNLEINDSINVGNKSLKITKVLEYEPDRGNSFYSFTPRILMNWDDVEATQVIGPGSRVQYRYLFAGNDEDITELKKELAPTLELNQKFLVAEQANQTLQNTLTRATRFLNIAALIAVLLGATAAALVSLHYSNEMRYQYALLRCLGLQSNKMLGVIVIPIVLFSLLAITIGYLIGGVAHLLILNLLSDLIPETLPAPSVKPFLLGALTTVIVVTSFAWPFLRQLLKTAPKLLLNRIEVQQHPIVLTLVSMIFGLTVLVYLNTRDLLISVYVISILSFFILLAFYITKAIIQLYRRITQEGSASNRLVARSLNANQHMVIIQVVAIALTFFSLSIITTIRDDIINSWQSRLPDETPNTFVINLFEDDKQNFISKLNKHNIKHQDLYPIIRGRISGVNDISINEYVAQVASRGDESLNRDLALTWSMQLPKDNEIVLGEWHSVNRKGVSIEQGLAENLDIEIGDIVNFSIQSKKISVPVTSIRTVQWESFSPNFYMIFSDGVLDEFSASYMTSFYLDKSQRISLVEFVREFSSATFFDVEFLLGRIRSIIEKISYAIEMILYFSLVSSLLVFLSIEMILRKYRIYNTAIFKAVGAETKLIQKVFRLEFLIIGLISGVIAYLLNIAVSYAVSNYIIEGEFIFNLKTALLCLLIAPLLVLLLGYFSISRTQNVSVKKLLIYS